MTCTDCAHAARTWNWHGYRNACPNPRWRTGNGQPQWLERSFYRASIPTPPGPWAGLDRGNP